MMSMMIRFAEDQNGGLVEGDTVALQHNNKQLSSLQL